MTEQPGKSKEQEAAHEYWLKDENCERYDKDFEAGFIAGTEYALQQREQPWVRVEDGLPPKKEGWQHSNMCLVWYNGQPNVNVETYGIAYYNYEPPLNYPPGWVDFHNYGRKPSHWQALPPAPPKQ